MNRATRMKLERLEDAKRAREAEARTRQENQQKHSCFWRPNYTPQQHAVADQFEAWFAAETPPIDEGDLACGFLVASKVLVASMDCHTSTKPECTWWRVRRLSNGGQTTTQELHSRTFIHTILWYMILDIEYTWRFIAMLCLSNNSATSFILQVLIFGNQIWTRMDGKWCRVALFLPCE